MSKQIDSPAILGPNELIKKEKKKLIFRSFIAILLTNTAVMVFAKHPPIVCEQPKTHTQYLDHQIFISRAELHIQNRPHTAVAISAGGKLIIPSAILIECQGNQCQLAVPNHQVSRLLDIGDSPLQLFPPMITKANTSIGTTNEIIL